MFMLENEVDGEAFLLLTDEQIKGMVKAIGSQMKLIKKRNCIMQFSLISPAENISKQVCL